MPLKDERSPQAIRELYGIIKHLACKYVKSPYNW